MPRADWEMLQLLRSHEGIKAFASISTYQDEHGFTSVHSSEVRRLNQERSLWIFVSFCEWTMAGQLDLDRLDICEWMKAKGLLDTINVPVTDPLDEARHRIYPGTVLGPKRWTPLAHSISMVSFRDRMRRARGLRPEPDQDEAVPRWMVAHGADVTAIIDNIGTSIFAYACQLMSITFIEALVDRVPPQHLVMNGVDGGVRSSAPIRLAFKFNPDPVPVMKMLIRRGVALNPDELSVRGEESDVEDDGEGLLVVNGELLRCRQALLCSIEQDLATFDTIFIALLLGCGVHAENTTTPICTTVTTATTKTVRTQVADGTWSAPAIVQLPEPRAVVTPSLATADYSHADWHHYYSENPEEAVDGFFNYSWRQWDR